MPVTLATLARASVAAGKSWPVGRLIEAGGALFDGSDFTALFATSGGYLPPNAVIVSSVTPPVEIAWLIPLHADEASTVRKSGWEELERQIERTDPDLLDLERPRIPRGG